MNTRSLHTKSVTAAILALVASPALAQFDDHGCGSGVRPEEVAQALNQQQSGMYRLPSPPQDTNQFNIVRIKVHIVRTSGGAGGISENAIEASVHRANIELVSSRTFLIAQGEVDYIDNDDFFFNINTTPEIDALRAVRPQANMLNIYFTQNLANENGGLCGISSFTFSSSQGIVMANSCTTGDSVLSHEIGHYFDLFHTHETAVGAECVNGSNCATAGDLVCDTPADPGLSGRVNTQCQYTGGPLDPCSNAAYVPNTHNTMSYSRFACMDHFTAQQSARAQAALLNGRPAHLVTTSDFGFENHLDTAAATNGNGAWNSPMNSFSAALDATPTGAVLAISRAGADEGPVTLNRRMIIYNNGPETGVVRLGAP